MQETGGEVESCLSLVCWRNIDIRFLSERDLRHNVVLLVRN